MLRLEIEFMRGRTFAAAQRCYDDGLGRNAWRLQGRLWCIYAALVIGIPIRRKVSGG